MSERVSEARFSPRLIAWALGLTVMATLGASGAGLVVAAGAAPTGKAATVASRAAGARRFPSRSP